MSHTFINAIQKRYRNFTIKIDVGDIIKRESVSAKTKYICLGERIRSLGLGSNETIEQCSSM